MKHKIRKILAAAIILCLLFPSAVQAFNSYQIDVEEVKNLSKSSSFPLVITKKTVTDGVNSDRANPDMLTLTIQNGTGAEINKIVVMVVCYDEEGKAKPLYGTGGLSAISMGTEKRELSVLTFDKLSAADGAEFQVNIGCCHANYTGAQALVAQYTSGEEEVTNPEYEAWQESALGNPTHILD